MGLQMDTRDPFRIGCPLCGALPGCFCKSQSGVIFTLHEARRLVRRRAPNRKSIVEKSELDARPGPRLVRLHHAANRDTGEYLG
jgi:hypothetical protein